MVTFELDEVIRYSKQLLDAMKERNMFLRQPWVYIYFLSTEDEPNVPFYVGATIEPILRFLEHMMGNTVSNCDKIEQLDQAGIKVLMNVIDITTKSDRDMIEAYWMFKFPNLTNDLEAKLSQYRKYCDSPDKFQSLSLGTLTSTNPLICETLTPAKPE